MTTAPSPDRTLFYGWYVVAASFVLLFCLAGSGFYSFSIFIKPLESEFGWSRSGVALAISIYLIMSGFSSPIVGRLCQAYGPRKVMLFGASVGGACLMLLGLTSEIWYFYLIYAVLAFPMVSISFVPVSSVLTKWFVRRRGTAIGVAYMGLAAGGMVYAPLVGHITARFGWKISYLFMGLAVWVLALPAILFVIKEDPREMNLLADGGTREHPGATRTAETKAPPVRTDLDLGMPLKQALGTGSYWWVVFSFFLGGMSQMAILQHQVPLIFERGIPLESAAVALGLTSAMGAFGKISFGRLAESIPIQWVFCMCFSFQLVGVVMLLNLNAMAMVWAYAVVFGFGMGGVVVLQPLVVGQFFGMASFGTILGTLNLAFSMGSSIGAYAAGFVHDLFGNYHVALIAFMILYGVAIGAFFIAGKRHSVLGKQTA